MSRLSDKFHIVPGQHRPRPIRNGIIFLALLAGVLYSGFTKSIPFVGKGGTTVTAHFASASDVISGNLVRVKGVDVGRVTRVHRDPSGKGALVDMRVDEDGFKLHSDARASIYWRTLLGRNVYIELDPGSTDRPALGSATIPTSRTSSQVELDQLLQSFNEDGRAGIQTFFEEGDKMLGGPQLGNAVDELPTALQPVGPAVQALRGTHKGEDLGGLVDSASRALRAMSTDEASLSGLIDHADTVLGVTAARRANLGAMLQRAPETMQQARATLARLRTTLDVLDPVAADLRPGLRATAPAIGRATGTLRALSAIAPTTVAALRNLDPALANLQRASNEGDPALAGLTPTIARLQDEILPFLAQTDPGTKLRNYEAIGPFFSVLASSSSEFDAAGHVQRFMPGQGLDSVGALPCSVTAFDPATKNQLVKCERALRLLPQIVAGAPRKGGGRKYLTDRKASR